MSSEQELRQIAAQLRCPDGEHGIMIGDNMNSTNRMMTRETLAILDVQPGSTLLELGPGNAGHVTALFDRCDDLRYVGLDISPTMCEQARKLNSALIAQSVVQFDHYDGVRMPYEANRFEKVFTVNTIYFWERPRDTLAELARVLKPDGILVVTFASKRFMQTLPFTTYGFKLYSKEDIAELVKDSSFKLVEIHPRTETVRSKVGDLVEREYYCVVCQNKDC